MTSTTDKLTQLGLARPPKFLKSNVHYETMMGSVAYGVSSDTSDVDIYGFCIPPKTILFPHLRGEIPGFGTPSEPFQQFQQHHIEAESELSGKGRIYDLSIYNITKYFQLAMQNNPNMIDSLFTPTECVISSTQVGNMVREQRRLFLHKGCWPRFKGYAYSQLHKMAGKNPSPGSVRDAIRQEHGYDVKYAYHLVRLLSECEQILAEGDLDLQEKGTSRTHEKPFVAENSTRQTSAVGPQARKNDSSNCTSLHRCQLRRLKARSKTFCSRVWSIITVRWTICVVEPDAAVVALREVQALLDRHAHLIR